MNSNNPLSKHFRHPSIHFKLPSGGRYWPEGSLNLPINGEIPIYPMTAKDEIVLRTPDALMNGAGIVTVIESCCPNILDAWQMPSIDVDAVLIAIRIASYGQDMEITATCPKCSEESNYDIPLNPILDNINTPNYAKEFLVNGVKIGFKPQAYFTATKLNIVRFQEDQLIKTITTENIPDEERTKMFDEQIKRLVDLNLEILTESTAHISTDDGVKVTEKEFIKEFYENCDTATMKRIRGYLDDLKEQAALPSKSASCTECGHEFSLNLEFDQSNFFGAGS